MRSLPLMTGLLTIAILAFVGVSLLSAESTWGWLILGLAGLRAVMLVLQAQRLRQAQRDAERHDSQD
ncbi:MAG: hypothetical protein EA397_02980 [Deltaproteobacteria bacterium]|nr:MAG: hypothetical protein EA397_02980 [Deltaproteobacteria bacterium]